MSENAPAAAAHVEVPVKINARVDAGVADLVRALSRFPRLETVASCEDPSHGRDSAPVAVVEFRYGDSWEGTVKFCLWLQDEFHARLDEGAWITADCRPHHQVAANIHVQEKLMVRVVAEIDAVANRWDADEEIGRAFSCST